MSVKTKRERIHVSEDNTVGAQKEVGYNPMRHTHFATKETLEVILLAPHQMRELEAPQTHLELTLDLRRALSEFTKRERQVLHRILVEGNSVEVATRQLKGGRNRSLTWWYKWFKETALPRLRSDLGDYIENGRLVF